MMVLVWSYNTKYIHIHESLFTYMYYSTVDRNRSAGGVAGGDEVITEYATTRRLDISVGCMSQDEAEKYYTREYQ